MGAGLRDPALVSVATELVPEASSWLPDLMGRKPEAMENPDESARSRLFSVTQLLR